ncbi:unnamed protein product [Vicia faba]|uniref:Ribosomal protein S14 n=1 Tax=Vicia faba TaxID=3906 RepID=A0AAV0Z7L5_VICFA|nr:unnamed protein product [Vicia faba]
MDSDCVSVCVNNKSIPIRPTFANLYKWPESEVEFVKTMNTNSFCNNKAEFDSLSCRQMYLRSYRFSRKKLSVTEKTIKCFNSVKESVIYASNRLNYNIKGNCKILGRAKYVTYASVSIFHRMLSRFGKVHLARYGY